MTILHYFLGFPPFRTGGLTQYCMDLMQQQKEDGNDVIALWPGRMKLLSTKVKIKRGEDNLGIKNYEIINPHPVPYDEGIIKIDKFVEACDAEVYYDYLTTISPDVIHVHTLMGIHKEFFEKARDLNIRIIYTTHDYFGICPKVDFFYQNNICYNRFNCEDCFDCNKEALPLWKLYILQSKIYMKLKDSKFMSTLRRKHRNREKSEYNIAREISTKGKSVDYKDLREYYVSILSMIQVIHCNSSVSKQLYEPFTRDQKKVVIPITHRHIMDRRNESSYCFNKTEKIRLAYMSPINQKKGFYILKQALDNLWNSGMHGFELQLFSEVSELSPYMKILKNGYKLEELDQIYNNIDLLCAPSLWPETFGFVVLEALNHAVPVLITDRVGAKDIVGNAGIILDSHKNIINQIENDIKELTSNKLMQLSQNTRECKFITWEELVGETYELYCKEK